MTTDTGTIPIPTTRPKSKFEFTTLNVLVLRIVGMLLLAGGAGVFGFECAWNKNDMERLVNSEVILWLIVAVIAVGLFFWHQKQPNTFKIGAAFILAMYSAVTLKDVFVDVYWSGKLTAAVFMVVLGLALSAVDYLIKLNGRNKS